jgi:hypothetical protein
MTCPCGVEDRTGGLFLQLQPAIFGRAMSNNERPQDHHESAMDISSGHDATMLVGCW